MNIRIEATDSEYSPGDIAEALETKGLEVIKVDVVDSRHESTQLIELIVTVVGSIGISMLSNWLYDMVKSKKATISINSKEVTVQDKDGLTRLVEREIRID